MALNATRTELTAVLIAPDREIAAKFLNSIAGARTFEILADLKSYLPEHTLEMRLKQLRPDIVLIDAATDTDQACGTIEVIARLHPESHIVAVHRTANSDTILRTLRAGAIEFLDAFDATTHAEAIARLRRLRETEAKKEDSDLGNVVVFSSVKPGSGASTLATQTAFALKRLAGKRILLADFDLTGGTIGFYLKLTHQYSLVEALQCAERLDSSLWSSLIVSMGEIDILPAPVTPYAESVDPNRLQVVLEYARSRYDWVVIDLPTIFQRVSLVALSQSERAFLVSTSELPSLHLARKAVTMLEQFGLPKDRFQIVVNRVNKKDGISSGDMEKLFNCSVHASFPNDYFSLHRVVTLGQPLGSEGDLGKAIDNLASQLSGQMPAAGRGAAGLTDVKLAFSVL
jgi:pilus assembly protein CpaE